MNIGEEIRERERERVGYTYTAMRFNIVRILVSAGQVKLHVVPDPLNIVSTKIIRMYSKRFL
jgi:hypothetical protein